MTLSLVSIEAANAAHAGFHGGGGYHGGSVHRGYHGGTRGYGYHGAGYHGYGYRGAGYHGYGYRGYGYHHGSYYYGGSGYYPSGFIFGLPGGCAPYRGYWVCGNQYYQRWGNGYIPY